jgi:hypothetical protein
VDRQNVGISALVVALLAGLAVGFPFVATNAPNSRSGLTSLAHPLSRSIEKHGLPEHSALDAILDSFDGDPDQVPTKPIWAQTNPQWSHDLVGASNPYRLTVIVASLPDPFAPALREMFDDRVDAIQRAAETDDYVLDSVDLPWPGTASGSGIRLDEEIDLRLKQDGDDNLDTSASSPYVSAVGNPDDSARYLKDPGVILFHAKKDSKVVPPGSRLLVFVVGETPTSGVNELALRSALDQTAWLCGWEDKPRQDPIDDRVFTLVRCEDNAPLRILGPTNSGSADSIEVALSTWRAGLHKQPAVMVISGTATLPDLFHEKWITYSTTSILLNAALFTEFLESQFNCLEFEMSQFFQATLSDAPPQSWATYKYPKKVITWVTKHLKHHLKSKLDKVAIVAEADTAYGQSFHENRSVLVLHFPMYISNVRRADQRIAGLVQAPTKSNIRLPADESGEVDYLPRHYSPRSVISDQLVLENLLDTIHRERIRFIAIVASDPEDRVFLAQQIRDSCPDTSVFLFRSDLMYLHSDFNADLRGDVVLSTYPLFAANRLWTYPFTGTLERHQYPNEGAEGVFNAALALLDKSDLMEDFGAPFARKPLKPVLWASIVGKDDLWPLGYYSLPEPDHLSLAQIRPSKDNSAAPPVALINRGFYPAPFMVLFLIGSLLAGGWSVLLLAHYPAFEYKGLLFVAARSSTEGVASLIGFPTSRNDSTHDELVSERRLFLLALTIGIAALYLIVAIFLWLPFVCASLGSFEGTVLWFPDTGIIGYLIVLAIVLSVLTLSTCILAIFSLVRRYDSSLRPRNAWDAAKMTELASGANTTESATAESVAPAPHPESMDASKPILGRHSGVPRRSSLKILKSALTSPILSSLIFAGAAVWYCMSILLPWPGMWHYGSVETFYLFYRATNLGNGVSPLVPILLVGTGALALLFCSLRRVAIIRIGLDSGPILSFTAASKSFKGIVLLEERLRGYLRAFPNELPGAASIFCLGAFGGVWLWVIRPNNSVDGRAFDLLILLGAFAVFVAVAWALLRLVLSWSAMRAILRRLYRHPSRGVYQDFHDALPGRQSIKFAESTVPLTAIETSLEQAREMLRLAGTTGTEAARHELMVQLQPLAEPLSIAEGFLNDALLADAEKRWEDELSARANAEKAITKLGEEIIKLLEGNWRLSKSGLNSTLNSTTTVERRVYKSARLFLASRVVDLLREVFPHFRNLMTLVTTAILLALLAMSSYPFAQRDTLLTIAWLFVASAVGTMGYVFISMNRDRVLSLCSGTTPGRITWNSTLVTQIVVYGVLPILGLLDVQFPGQVGSILSWFSKLGGRPT